MPLADIHTDDEFLNDKALNMALYDLLHQGDTLSFLLDELDDDSIIVEWSI